MDLKLMFAITLLIVILLTVNVSSNRHVFKIQNLPKDEFVLTKSAVGSDDDILRRYSKDLGKVSDDVKYFVEKSLRVAKAFLRDWLLKNDDGSDIRDTKQEKEGKDDTSDEQ